MSYGISVIGDALESYANGTSTPLLYWGKKVITFTPDSTNNVIVDGFGFPDSWNVMFFFHTLSARDFYTGEAEYGGSYVQPIKSDGEWKFSFSWANMHTEAVVAVYAFVDPKYIPIPAWGMSIYDEAGNIAFHTAAPSLALSDVGTYTGTYKPACTGEAYGFTSHTHGQTGRIFSTVYCVMPHALEAGGYTIFSSVTATSSSKGFYVRSFTIKAPVINADYYDGFPSLGDYVP